MTAAYQDERITVTAEGISVGQKAFTMNLVNHAAITVTKPSGKPPWKKLILSFALTTTGLICILLALMGQDPDITGFFMVLTIVFTALTIFLLTRCLRLNKKTLYNLNLTISGNGHTVLSSTDKDYIHMLAGLINTFKGYTPHPEPSFDYEGEVLE
jgi:hypothetical protein